MLRLVYWRVRCYINACSFSILNIEKSYYQWICWWVLGDMFTNSTISETSFGQKHNIFVRQQPKGLVSVEKSVVMLYGLHSYNWGSFEFTIYEAIFIVPSKVINAFHRGMDSVVTVAHVVSTLDSHLAISIIKVTS